MLLSAIGVLLISSGALSAPSDAVEVGVCDGDGCSALKSSVGAIEVILLSLISIVSLWILARNRINVPVLTLFEYSLFFSAREKSWGVVHMPIAFQVSCSSVIHFPCSGHLLF